MGHVNIKDVEFNPKCNEKAQDSFTALIWNWKILGEENSQRLDLTKVQKDEYLLSLKIFPGTYCNTSKTKMVAFEYLLK